MGSFYVNITLRGPNQREVVKALMGRRAFVGPPVNGCVVVSDQQCDRQEEDKIASLTSSLSRTFQCPALAVLIHDDDILKYQLFQGGNRLDVYDSSPGYFAPDGEFPPPEGGNAQLLCAVFGVDRVDEVEQILRSDCQVDDRYAFETHRHADLVDALALPSYAVGYGYSYLKGGNLPEGLSTEELARTDA